MIWHSPRPLVNKDTLIRKISGGLRGDLPEASQSRVDISLECVEFGQPRPAALTLYYTAPKQVSPQRAKQYSDAFSWTIPIQYQRKCDHRCLATMFQKVWFVWRQQRCGQIQDLIISNSTWPDLVLLKREDNTFHINDCQESRKRWGWEGSRCDYRRETGGILVAMEMFSLLAVSMSVSWLWHYSRIWGDVTVGVNWAKCAWISIGFLQLFVNLQLPPKKLN